MLMDIPHILVSILYIFDQSTLSEDRCKTYSIENKKLIDITNKAKKEQSREHVQK